jgi:Tol biopolymer transport system component
VRHLRETLLPEMRVEISTPSTLQPLQFALSPDGRQIVFVASGTAGNDCGCARWTRSMRKPLAGTEGAEYPFWSADGRSLGFFAMGKLYRLDIAGGSPQSLATIGNSARGGAWSADGTILISRSTTSGLSRIAATGGELVAVTRPDPALHYSHRFPQFLPDGRHFIFYAMGTEESSAIYLGSLDGGEPSRLMASDSSAAFMKPDRVVAIQQGTLMTRRLDVARGVLTGEPVTVANQVGIEANTSLGGFSASGDGRSPIASACPPCDNSFGSTGRQVGGRGRRTRHEQPSVSRTVARRPSCRLVSHRARQLRHLAVDLVRGGLTRLTSDTGVDSLAVWSPDGMRIAFSSNRKSTWDLYQKTSNGSGTEDRPPGNSGQRDRAGWSRDGRFLVYYAGNSKTGLDLWALEMTGSEHHSRVVANTTFEEAMAELSPDGRWVAYQTNESGRFEIVVQPFPDPGGKWRYRRAAAPRRAGELMARRSTSLRPTRR